MEKERIVYFGFCGRDGEGRWECVIHWIGLDCANTRVLMVCWVVRLFQLCAAKQRLREREREEGLRGERQTAGR